MGAVAGRSGRHRPRLAGAALVLTLALVAPASAPAASRTFVSWSTGGGFAGGVAAELVVHRDHTAIATKNGSKRSARHFKLTRGEWARLRKRIAQSHFRALPAEFKPPMPVPDGTYESVRYRGHTVTVSTGAVPPGRLERLLTTLYRIYKRPSR